MRETSLWRQDLQAFLNHFKDTSEATLNFCVLGGIFSEGIDLTKEQLIGVMVVGVGIPQIGLERDLIKGYFDEVGKEGYHYAYTYPGINKVLQAIGRLIRTENDRGLIILVDDRYQTRLYNELLPHQYQYVTNNTLISKHRRVRHRATHVLLVHFFINCNGRIKIIGNFACFARRSSRPHFCHIYPLFFNFT